VITLSGELVAVAEAKHSTNLRKLRFSVLLISLPFSIAFIGLPLLARGMGASTLAMGGNKSKEKMKCHHQRIWTRRNK
jgi:hypothetical protein